MCNRKGKMCLVTVYERILVPQLLVVLDLSYEYLEV